MAFDPTPEQHKIIEAAQTGEDLVIEAGAGTGKTSTLRLIGDALAPKRGIYVAYNRAIAQDAKASFPKNVECATAHSYAFRAVGIQYKHRLNGPRVTLRQQASLMGIRAPFQLTSELRLSPSQQVSLVNQTLGRYCNSADEDISGRHVVRIDGDYDRTRLQQQIVPIAKRAWVDIKNTQGRLPFKHDYYLKLWALGSPRLSADFILFDEAQDANPVIDGVVGAQDCQKIMVGDASQAIYGWRGAVDAMSSFKCRYRLQLSQSFRFGPAVAAEANVWLGLLDASLRLTGFEQVPSVVRSVDDPDAILCRTNAMAIGTAIELQARGKRVAIVGGADHIKKMAEAAIELQAGKQPWNPEFAAFQNWGEFKQYVEDEDDGNLKVFVRLVEDYGAQTIIDVANQSVSEDKADVVVSTAHKAKGREWDTVQIAPDFREPDREKGEELRRDEMMLAYVAVTRAKKVLDNIGLAWVSNWTAVAA